VIVCKTVLNNRFQMDVDPTWLLFVSPCLSGDGTNVVAQVEFLARDRLERKLQGFGVPDRLYESLLAKCRANAPPRLIRLDADDRDVSR
jgi:hypothetical protein